jgi:flagellar basal-body rod protein FlgB
VTIEPDLTRTLETYLDTATLQLKVTAENMANIDTPGYKTQGFNFDEQMAASLTGNRLEESASSRNIANGQSLVDGLISRPDGNNVSIDREGMKMAEAQLKFKTGVALIKQEISRLSDAIHSDAK